MRHIVVEGLVVRQWESNEWVGIPWSRVEAYSRQIGEAYLWPSREAAERCGFIPPADAVFEPGKWVQADAGQQWADTSARVADRLVDGWVAVADRLPAETKDCLVTDGSVVTCRIWNARAREWIDVERCEYPCLVGAGITHWQPVPAPPRR
jgi:hypothetical protein